MSTTSTNREYGAVVVERLSSWLTPRWFLKTLGGYVAAAAVAALLFFAVAGTMAYPSGALILMIGTLGLAVIAAIVLRREARSTVLS
jgi:hypothetical protein